LASEFIIFLIDSPKQIPQLLTTLSKQHASRSASCSAFLAEKTCSAYALISALASSTF